MGSQMVRLRDPQSRSTAGRNQQETSPSWLVTLHTSTLARKPPQRSKGKMSARYGAPQIYFLTNFCSCGTDCSQCAELRGKFEFVRGFHRKVYRFVIRQVGESRSDLASA